MRSTLQYMLLAVFLAACSGPDLCSQGEPSCPCYRDSTCNEGLVCAEGYCIKERDRVLSLPDYVGLADGGSDFDATSPDVPDAETDSSDNDAGSTDDATQSDASESVDEDASIAVVLEDFVADWSCIYTQTTGISGIALDQPRSGEITLEITNPTQDLLSVKDALGLSGTLFGELQDGVLVARNDDSLYRLSFVGSDLTGSWTNLVYPLMITNLHCTR